MLVSLQGTRERDDKLAGAGACAGAGADGVSKGEEKVKKVSGRWREADWLNE